MRNRRPVALLVALPVLGMLALASVGPQVTACPRHYAPRDTRPAYAKVNGRWEVRIDTQNRWYSFQGSNMRLQGVYVYTRDERLARFIKDHGNTAAFWQALRTTAQRFTCADLMMGQTLAKVEKAMAKTVLEAYRKQTRRSAVAPDLMLGVYEGYGISCNPPPLAKP